MSIQSVHLLPKAASSQFNSLEEKGAQNSLKSLNVFGLSLPFLSLNERNALAQVNKDLRNYGTLLLDKDVVSFHRPNQDSQNLSINYRDGARYEGAWENGKRHGQGICRYADGARYEGAWENDKMHGQGILRCANGSRYEGAWENGKMHGQGILRIVNGALQYEGWWKNAKPHSRATLIDLITNERTSLFWADGVLVTTQNLFRSFLFRSLLYTTSPL